MDANKTQELRRVGYQIVPTCGMCQHGQDFSFGLPFGTCAIQTYQHQKHTGPVRQLSVHRSGWCPKFELNPKKVEELHDFMQFMIRKGT